MQQSVSATPQRWCNFKSPTLSVTMSILFHRKSISISIISTASQILLQQRRQNHHHPGPLIWQSFESQHESWVRVQTCVIIMRIVGVCTVLVEYYNEYGLQLRHIFRKPHRISTSNRDANANMARSFSEQTQCKSKGWVWRARLSGGITEDNSLFCQ